MGKRSHEASSTTLPSRSGPAKTRARFIGLSNASPRLHRPNWLCFFLFYLLETWMEKNGDVDDMHKDRINVPFAAESNVGVECN